MAQQNVKKDFDPFNSFCHSPVYDESRYVYFMESSYHGENGKRFGRVDLDIFTYEELPQLTECMQ